jgi:hypothetical protein
VIWTDGWTAALTGTIAVSVWLAAIWNKPSHTEHNDCACGESHRNESIVNDTLFAMSGLWLIAGWNDRQCPRAD